MQRPSAETEQRELASRIYGALNRFIGTLHGARCIYQSAIQQSDSSLNPNAVKYALQIAFGAIALTMRKYDDLHSKHLPQLIPEKSRRPKESKWLVGEIKNRNLRNTANQIIAHYADDKTWPLSNEEIGALIRSNGWETEEEVVSWVEQVIGKMIQVRDEIGQRYGIKG